MSRRTTQPESSSVARAFALSLLLHFIVFATIELGHGLGWWKHTIVPSWLRDSAQRQLAQERARTQNQRKNEPPKTQEEPTILIEVDPSQAVAEPPKDTPYYSTQSTLAADKKPDADTKKPNLDGKQEFVPRLKDQAVAQPAPPQPKTEDKRDPKPLEPQPLTPAPEKPPTQVAEAKPPAAAPIPTPKAETAPQAQPERKAGDLAMGTPAPRKLLPQLPTPDANPGDPAPPTQPRQRPRTLAMARQQQGLTSGEMMKQQGGVRRVELQPSMDVRGTPFGAYDLAFVAAVKMRWENLLDAREFVGSQRGKVVLDFRLHQDGRISDLQVREKDVSDMLSYLCERAILDPAPYQPFPSDLRRLIAPNDYREVRFTFFYY